MNKKHSLLALIGGIRCRRTLLETSFSLVHIVSPLDYQQATLIRIAGISINQVTAIILAYYKAAEFRAMKDGDCPDEDQFTAGVVGALMEGTYHLNINAKIWLGACAHCTYSGQSGVTIHSTYPDEGKLFPQTQLSLYEKGRHITTQYAEDLTLLITKKD